MTNENNTIKQNDEAESEVKLKRYRPSIETPPAETLADAADGMEEFNRLLKEIAKSFWIIVAMLLGVFFLVIAYYMAEFMVTL